MSAPDGSSFEEWRYCSTFGQPNCATDKAGLAYRTKRPFVMTEKHWINLVFSGADIIKPGGVVSCNPVVDFEYTTLLDAGNNPLKMSAKAFQYDFNGNIRQIKEYDWFDPALVFVTLKVCLQGYPPAQRYCARQTTLITIRLSVRPRQMSMRSARFRLNSR